MAWAQEFKTSLANVAEPISTKSRKISQAWWHLHVISATWGAEAEELPELGKQRLQWAQMVPLQPSLGKRGRPCVKKTVGNGGCFHVFLSRVWLFERMVLQTTYSKRNFWGLFNSFPSVFIGIHLHMDDLVSHLFWLQVEKVVGGLQ